MSGPRVLPVHTGRAAYDVWLGAGLLPRLGALVTEVHAPSCVAVVTDDVVARLHLEGALAALAAEGLRAEAFVVPAGEGSKSPAEAERLWTHFGGMRLGRGDVVVALGGGVVGDLAGFCAATWHRGVPVVQVPTTLLAMADAAIGGKVAIDLPIGRNLVGAFHHPLRVVADVATLATLPRRDVAAGLGEVVKCAVLDERGALATLRERATDLLAGAAAPLADAVALGMRVKIGLVSQDPEERGGRRVLLNLGHTTAHALETACGHGVLRHGEAVAVGLVVAARIAATRGLADAALTEEIAATLRALELPTELPPDTDLERVVELSRRDKKAHAGTRRMVLPVSPSAPAEAGPSGSAVVVDVGDDELRAALASARPM